MHSEAHADGRAKLLAAWNALREAAPIGPIRDDGQHAEMIAVLDHLQHEAKRRRGAQLDDLIAIVVKLISDYEDQQHPIPNVEPPEVLRFLMEQHGLRQSDLKSEIGSQSVVSEILNGKREINARQAKALGVRFGVLPHIFL